MLLVVTNRDDLTADGVILEMRRRQAEYLRFNSEDYPSSIGLRWTADGDGALTIGGREFNESDVDTIWYRRPVPPVLPDGPDDDLREWASREAQEALDGLWRTFPVRWVNHPDADARADCKQDQLRTALRLGFSVPPTLVTNNPVTAREFVAAHSAVVCKPLFDGLVTRAGREELFWTTSLDPGAMRALDELGPEPYLLQAEVVKEVDVRVTVMGERVFAVAIRGPDDAPVDWRRTPLDRLRHEPVVLPEHICELCVTLVRHYDLRFGAIDLALTDRGYEFFELNPNGQWAWLEDETGLPLRAAMVDLLLGDD